MNSVVWQYIPESINPIAFSVGFFSVRWYAFFFLCGFLAAMLFILELRKKEDIYWSKENIYDMFFTLFLGVYVGARLGYVFFYNMDVFVRDPLRIILPYDFHLGVWVGISGMSFHGGLIGAALGLYWFARTRKMSFWWLADRVSLATPIALLFGRLGNFFNMELYGRVTDKPWGMYFSGTLPLGVLRHPAPLYAAFLEGATLFVLLLYIRFRYKKLFPGALAALFLMGYATLRCIGEYFREPDPQIGFLFGGLTLGQVFSMGMFVIGISVFSWLKWKNHVTIERQQKTLE